MSLFMDSFRLIQCYHCLSFEHVKSNCPQKFKPRYCARCGDTDHPIAECVKATECLHCKGPHPATARCCPMYQQLFQQKYQALVHVIQDQLLPSQHFNSYGISTPPSNYHLLDNTWSRIQQVASAADTPNDFVNTLFTLAKASKPKKPYNPKAYNDDLHFSQENIHQAYKLTYEEDEPQIDTLECQHDDFIEENLFYNKSLPRNTVDNSRIDTSPSKKSDSESLISEDNLPTTSAPKVLSQNGIITHIKRIFF